MQKFDEMYAMLPFDGSDVREHYKRYAHWLAQQPAGVMQARRAEAEMIFRRVGITFAVYGAKDEGGAGSERLIPFDLIPRIIPAPRMGRMQRGLVQRVTALNRFIHDVYHGQDILRAGIVPADLVLNNAQYRPEMAGVQVPQDVYAHIAGIDIVRAADAQGERRVLRAGRQPARAQRRELHAGKPQDDDAAVPRAVQPARWRPWPITPTCCWKPCAPAPRPRRTTHGGGAHARHAQQRVLRARLPGPADGRGAGGRAGPGGQGQVRLHAHHARPAAGGRDLPPRGR
jgi:hypothetical protein